MHQRFQHLRIQIADFTLMGETVKISPRTAAAANSHSTIRYKSTVRQNLTDVNLVIMIVVGFDVSRYSPQQILRIIFDKHHGFGVGKVFTGGQNDFCSPLRWWISTLSCKAFSATAYVSA